MHEKHLRPRSQLFVTTAGIRGPGALMRTCSLAASEVIGEFCDGLVIARDTIERLGLSGCQTVLNVNNRRNKLDVMIEQSGPHAPAEREIVLDLLRELTGELGPRAFLLTQHPYPDFKVHEFVSMAREYIGNGRLPQIYTRTCVPDHFHSCLDDPDKVLVATGVWCDAVNFRPPADDHFSEKIDKLIDDRGAGASLVIVLHHKVLDGLEKAQQVTVLRECRRQVNDLNRRHADSIDLSRKY